MKYFIQIFSFLALMAVPVVAEDINAGAAVENNDHPADPTTTLPPIVDGSSLKRRHPSY